MTPSNPEYGDKIKLTVYLDGELKLISPRCKYDVRSETMSVSGGVHLTEVEGDKYYVEFGPYYSYTELWIVVYIPYSKKIVVHQDTFYIGTTNESLHVQFDKYEYEPLDLKDCSSVEIRTYFNYSSRTSTRYGGYQRSYEILYPDGRSIGRSGSAQAYPDYISGGYCLREEIKHEGNGDFPYGTLILFRASFGNRFVSPGLVLSMK